MCHSPVFSSAPIQGQDFWQQLLNSEIAEPPANQMTLLWQKIQVRLLGKQLTPRLRPLSLASAFAVQVQHPGSHSLGLHPRPALHSGFPAFLFWLQVQVWVCELRSTPKSCPFPRCRSRLAAHSHLSVYRVHELFLFHSQATDHFPQLLPLLFTLLFPWFSAAPMFCPRAIPFTKHFTSSCCQSPLGFSQTVLAISCLFSHLLP